MIADVISSLTRTLSPGLLLAVKDLAQQQERAAKLWAGHEMVEYIRQKEKVNELEYWKQAWGEESRVLAKSVANA